MLAPDEFYNLLADRYDAMTRFSARLEEQRSILSDLLVRLPARRVIDMGCGTGLHAVALAQLGIEVTGVDISAGMLEKARAHALDHAADIRFLEGDFTRAIPGAPADLVICLGNSLPHLGSTAELAAVLGHWRTLCKPGCAQVLLQLLNYRRVLDRRERIVNIRRDGSRTTVRFYDFLDSRLQFNILTIDDTEGGSTHSLQSTILTPFLQSDILDAAHEVGFTSILAFGSLRLDPFTPESADLLMILTEKA